MITVHYKSDFDYFFTKKYYMTAVILTAVLCFGYSATHVTVGGDTLKGDLYLGDGNIMLAAGRIGMVLWAKLLGYNNAETFYQPSVIFFCVLMLVLAAVHFCMLLRRVCGESISLFGHGVFACVFVSYPLINEIWQYPGANATVCGGFLLVAVALYILYNVFEEPKLRLKQKIIWICLAAVCLMVVCSGYESLAVVYVFGVFMILLLQQLRNSKFSLGGMILRGMAYAGPLLAGFVLRIVVHRALLLITGLTAGSGGETDIVWGTAPFFEILLNLIRGCSFMYVFQGSVYFPIGEFVLAVLLFAIALVVFSAQKRDPLVLLAGAGMLLSLFLLPLIQGKYTGYRTCQVFTVMVAFAAMATYEIIRLRWKTKKVILHIVRIFLVLLCVQQATYLNHLLVLDNLRWEEEAFVVRTVGTDVMRSFDSSKPIILTGYYNLPAWIQEETKAPIEDYPFYHWMINKLGVGEAIDLQSENKFVQTNVNSILSKVISFSKVERERLFSYCGFDFTFEEDDALIGEAKKFALENDVPGYPEDGYIFEWNDHIIVNFS